MESMSNLPTHSDAVKINEVLNLTSVSLHK